MKTTDLTPLEKDICRAVNAHLASRDRRVAALKIHVETEDWQAVHVHLKRILIEEEIIKALRTLLDD